MMLISSISDVDWCFSKWVKNRCRFRSSEWTCCDTVHERVLAMPRMPRVSIDVILAGGLAYYGGSSDIYISVHFGETLGGSWHRSGLDFEITLI
jgi:hypothetical protein